MYIRVIRSSGGGKDKIVGGIIITAVFGLAAILCALSDDAGELFALMILFAMLAMGGVGMIVRGVQIKNRHKADPHPTHEFDADAPDFVKERLNELMFEGNPTTTSVSKTIKRVTYTGPDGVTRTTETVTQTGGSVSGPKSYRAGTVTCEACGGINKLRRGQSGICEYCGSHIQG